MKRLAVVFGLVGVAASCREPEPKCLLWRERTVPIVQWIDMSAGLFIVNQVVVSDCVLRDPR